MTTAGAVRSGPQCLQFPAAGPLSSVPHHRTQLGPVRPSSAHLPGAPRPEHLFSPSLRPPDRAPRPRPHRSLPGPEDWPRLRFWPPCSGRWSPPKIRTPCLRAARTLPLPSLRTQRTAPPRFRPLVAHARFTSDRRPAPSLADSAPRRSHRP